VGAVVGAALCAGMGWQAILDRARRIDWPDIAGLTIPRKGFLRMDRFEGLIRDTIGVQDFAELAIPLRTVAVDLATGRQVVFSEGLIARAVRASCSVPGVFEPLEEGEGVLVDGGLLNEVPADVARAMGADVVLAVSLTADRRHDAPPRNVLDIIYYSFDILLAARTQESLRAADLVVAPVLSGFSYRDLRRVEELVRRGETAMRESVGTLKKLIAAADRAQQPPNS
jgi:NTE family protein